MRTRLSRGVLGTLLVTLLLAGCSAETDGGGSAGSSEPLTLQLAGDVEEVAVYERLVAAFEQEHPDLDVELVAVGSKDEHLQKLNASFAAGDPPEVFLVNFREYSQYVVRGAIDPVGPRLEEAGVDFGAYYPQPVEAFTFNDQLQCMPQNISSLVVYANKAHFKQAGVTLPHDGWDLEEFRSVARRLTEGDVDGLGVEPTLIRLAPLVWTLGGDIVDDLDSPTRLTVDDPAFRQALEYLVSLVRNEGVVPTEQEIAGQDLETRFATGKLGMFLSSRRDTPVFREAIDLEWDVLPLPVELEPASILHSDAYCVSAQAADNEAALELVRFATSPDGATITALGGRTVPSLIAVAESGAFLDPTQPPEHAEVFLEAIPHIRRTPVIPTWPEIEDVAEEVMTRAFYEESYSVEEALQEMDERTRPLFEESAGS